MSNKDVIGRELKVGDFVAREGAVFKVKKINPKMITGEYVCGTRSVSGRFYAFDCAILPENEVLMFILTNK